MSITSPIDTPQRLTTASPFTTAINHSLATAIVGGLLTGATIALTQINQLSAGQQPNTLTGIGIGLLAAGVTGILLFARAHHDDLTNAVDDALNAAETANNAMVAADGHAAAASQAREGAQTALSQVVTIATRAGVWPPSPVTPDATDTATPAEIQPSTTGEAAASLFPKSTTTETMPAASANPSDQAAPPATASPSA